MATRKPTAPTSFIALWLNRVCNQSGHCPYTFVGVKENVHIPKFASTSMCHSRETNYNQCWAGTYFTQEEPQAVTTSLLFRFHQLKFSIYIQEQPGV